MAYTPKTSLEEILNECENLLEQYGICNYAEVARRLNVTRQAIQKRLAAAAERGDITPRRAERYRPMASKLTHKFNTSLTPENYEFLKGLAGQLEVHPAYILHAAINRYREGLLDGSQALPLRASIPPNPTHRDD